MNYKDIQKQFNAVIAYSQEADVDDINTDDLFKRWLEAKRNFIEMMNGQLIWEYPEKVTFELSEADKDKRLDDFLADDIKYELDLVKFIETERKGFFKNEVVIPYEYNGIKIPVGMKLVKAFKYFIDDDKIALDKFQNAASQLIQLDKIEGTLCLSVHPLDFLSSGENCCKWRSCHALNGEYRSGNLSYMVDSATIMCYLREDGEHILPHFPLAVPWNSKKWRVLLFFSDNWDMIFAGRQYPFTSDYGLNFILEDALERLGVYRRYGWLSKKIDYFEDNDFEIDFITPYIPLYHGKLVPLTDIVKDNPYSLQYNDLLYSHYYSPQYTFTAQAKKVIFQDPIVHVGDKVLCCRCGQQQISRSETFFCDDCDEQFYNNYVTCDCCGDTCHVDDIYYVASSGEYFCPSCIDEYTVVCEDCGCRILTDDAVYNEENECWYCYPCYDKQKGDT